MKKNYYEILEISENASQEIVEKAYKTLAMKYHPDLHGDSTGDENFEEKLKLINEAYGVLKDKEKRAEYDEEMRIEAERDNLAAQIIAKKLEDVHAKDNIAKQEDFLAQQQEILNRAAKQQQEILNEAARQQQEELNKAYEKAYNDAYVQDLKRRGYKVKYKKPFKAYIPVIIAVIVVLAVFVLLWQIPFVRNYFVELYNNNSILQLLLSPFLGN